MIYVNQKQLDQVEYILEQSARGHHVLFDNDMIRQVFGQNKVAVSKDDSESEEDSVQEAVEKHIENLILQPTLVSKRAYLENLSPEIQMRVIKTYFAIVENNIFEELEFAQ